MFKFTGKQGFHMAGDVICSGCGAHRAQDTPDLIFGGWWPLTAAQPTTFLDMRLLDAVGALETAAPPLSMRALLQSVNAQSWRFGGEGGLQVGREEGGRAVDSNSTGGTGSLETLHATGFGKPLYTGTQTPTPP
jgi:hypothetical protein